MNKEKNKGKTTKYIFLIILLLVLSTITILAILIYSKYGDISIEENEIEKNTISETNINENEIIPIVDTSQIDTSQINPYVALGDSITYGSSLEDNSYRFSSLMESNLNLNTKNYGVDGMTSEWLLSELEKGKYKDDIKNAKLITLSIGSNDVLIAVYQTIARTYGLKFYDNDVIGEATELFKNSSLEGKYEMLKKLFTELTSDQMEKDIEKSLKNYKKNFGKVIEKIKEINPEVKIIAIDYYNPYHEIFIPFFKDVSDKINVQLDSYVDELNNHLYKNTNLGYDVAYIKDEMYSHQAYNSYITLLGFNLDPHPNKLGHTIIYNSILKTLIGR